MLIEPDYISFKKRFFSNMKESAIIFLIIILIASIVTNVGIWKLFVFILLPLYIILMVQSFYINKFCLKSFYFDESKHSVQLYIYKYDKLFKVYDIALNDLRINLYQILYSLFPWYVLKFYRKRDKVYSQRQNLMWSLDKLKEIQEIIIKGKKELNQ